MRLQPGRSVTAQLDRKWIEYGRDSAVAYAQRRAWLFRRVESITFLEGQSVRRRLSVDFEIPPNIPPLADRGAPDARLVPVSVLPKQPPLMNFDLEGPGEHPASLYTSDTFAALSFGLLMGLIDQILMHRGGPEWMTPTLPSLVEEMIAYVVADDGPSDVHVAETLRHLRDGLSWALGNSDRELARQAAETIDFAAQLGGVSVLWVPVIGSPGTDCVVKLSYRSAWEMRDPAWLRMLIACSWAEQTAWVSLSQAGSHTRYHLDVPAPPGLLLTFAEPRVFPGEKERANVPEPGWTAERTAPARALSGVSSDTIGHWSAHIADRQVHFYQAFRDAPSHRVFLKVRWAANRSGFIRSCLVAAVLLAALMTLSFAALGPLADHIDATVVLLGAVPVVLGYVLVRAPAGEHERQQLAGVRVIALLAGSLPIVGALALVLTETKTREHTPDIAVVRPLWAALLVVSWLLAVALACSWTCAANPDAPTATRWPLFPVRAGLALALAVILGAVIVCQPYAHVGSHLVVRYLHMHRARVPVGEFLAGLGSLGFYPFLGGLLEAINKPRDDVEAPRRSPVWRISLIVAGLAWTWTVGAVTALTGWQTLADTGGAGFAHAVDVAANASLVPAGVVIAIGTASLLWPEVRTRTAERVAVLVTGIVALGAITLRGLSALAPRVVAVAPVVGWTAFAAWVGVTAVALTYPLSGTPLSVRWLLTGSR